MDKHRKITVNDLTPEIINQLQEKFNAVPEIVQLHAKMHMFLQNHQAIKALSIGKHIQEAFNKVLAAYVDEVNNEAELVDIRNTGLSKDEVAKIDMLTLSLFMCCDIIDSCINDVNSVLAKKDESLRFEAFDEINDLAKEVKGKLSILSKQTSFMDKDDPEWGDTVDNMYQMMQNKAKSLIRKKGDSLVKN